MKSIVRVLIPFVAFVAWTGCTSLRKMVQKPKVTYRSVDIRSISFDRISVDVNFDVKNTNMFAVPLRAWDYTFMVGEYAVASGLEKTAMSIPANGSAPFSVPVTVKFADVMKAVGLIKDADEIPYTVKGSVTVDAGPLSGITVPFSHSDRIPRPRPPKVEIERISVRRLSFSNVDIDIRIKATNPGKLGYTLRDLKGAVRLNGTDLLSLDHTGNDLVLPSAGTESFTITARLSTFGLGKTLLSIISTGNARYELTGNAGVVTEMLGTLPLDINQVGVVNLFR
jgi:LEA14-like dessication related protein